jgi:hypothetical protein
MHGRRWKERLNEDWCVTVQILFVCMEEKEKL